MMANAAAASPADAVAANNVTGTTSGGVAVWAAAASLGRFACGMADFFGAAGGALVGLSPPSISSRIRLDLMPAMPSASRWALTSSIIDSESSLRPTEDAPAEDAPAEGKPVKGAPAKGAPAKGKPAVVNWRAGPDAPPELAMARAASEAAAAACGSVSECSEDAGEEEAMLTCCSRGAPDAAPRWR